MALQLEPSRDLGLQNVLRTGLTIIRDGDDANGHREQLLNALIDIFAEADRGSQRLERRSLAVSKDDRLAIERFTVFFRYLTEEYGDELSNRLAETTGVLKRMQTGDADVEEKTRAATLIEAFLSALSRDRALRPLPAPRTVQYG